MFDIKKIAKKINDFSQKTNEKQPADEKNEKRKFPIFGFILKPLNLFFDNAKKMLIISLIYGAVLSLLSFIYGYSYACSFSSEKNSTLYCAQTGPIYLLYLLIKMFILSNLMLTAYSILNKETDILKKIISFKNNMKSFGLLVFFSSMLFLPVIVLYILYIREPNPDFIIELTFFGFVSLGFLAPFIAVRFFSIYSGIFGEKVSLKNIFEVTKGCVLHILVSLFLIMIITVVIYKGFYDAFVAYKQISGLFIVIFSEYIYSTILSIIFIFITGQIYAQKTMIIDEEKLD